MRQHEKSQRGWHQCDSRGKVEGCRAEREAGSYQLHFESMQCPVQQVDKCQGGEGISMARLVGRKGKYSNEYREQAKWEGMSILFSLK